MNDSVEYQLVKTVTGKPKPPAPPLKEFIIETKRGLKLVAPFSPSPKCNVCYGRGYEGEDIVANRVIPCHKCYSYNKLKRIK